MSDDEKAAADTPQDAEPETEAPKKREREEEEEERPSEKKRKIDPTCPRESWLDGVEVRQDKAAGFFLSEAFLNEKLGDAFLAPEEIDGVMRSLASSGDLDTGAPIDFAWHAPIQDEPDVIPTATLLVTGMRLPFSRLLLRQYLEQRSGSVADEDFTVAGDSVYITYKSIETAQRQKRRISGAAWPNRNSNALSVAFSTREDAQAEVERANKEKTEAAASADSRVKASIISNSQKAAEDANSKPSRTTLEDLFTRTLAKPRLYFRFESAPHLVKKSRAKVEEEVRKMIRSGSV